MAQFTFLLANEDAHRLYERKDTSRLIEPKGPQTTTKAIKDVIGNKNQLNLHTKSKASSFRKGLCFSFLIAFMIY